MLYWLQLLDMQSQTWICINPFKSTCANAVCLPVVSLTFTPWDRVPEWTADSLFHGKNRACVCVLSHCSPVQLCNAIDWSQSGSSVHGILQARILERVAMPSSRGSPRPRDSTWVFHVSCIGRQVLYLGSPQMASFIKHLQFRGASNICCFSTLLNDVFKVFCFFFFFN